MRRCRVPNCRNNPSLHTQVSYHTFPKNPATRRIWAEFCGIQKTRISGLARICSDHFTSDCFSDIYMVSMGLKRRPTLSQNAIPTIQKPETCSSEEAEEQRKKLVEELLLRHDEERSIHEPAVVMTCCPASEEVHELRKEITALKLRIRELEKINTSLCNEN